MDGKKILLCISNNILGIFIHISIIQEFIRNNKGVFIIWRNNFPSKIYSKIILYGIFFPASGLWASFIAESGGSVVGP